LDAAILHAARTLFVSDGYVSVTMDAVAQAAGVGKTAIYRRWSSKAELAIAVLRAEAEPRVVRHEELEPFALDMARTLEALGPMLRELIAQAQSDPEVRLSLKRSLIEPRRFLLEELFSKHLPWASVVDIDARIAMVSGAFWYRIMIDESLDEEFVRAIARAALR
jgi:AcrR family transcriptional regulator